jgi:hypothetical protein
VRLREVGAQISRQEPHPPPALLREFSAIKAERNEIQEAQAAAGKEYALAQQAQGEAARVVRRAWLAGYSDKLTPATTKVLNAVGQLEEALTAYAAVYAPVERVGGCPPRAASDMQSYRDALEHLRSGLLAKLSAARGGGS